MRHDFAVIEVQISENDHKPQKQRLVSKGVDRFGGILGLGTYQKS
jgi:hypothetical protein